MGVFLEKLREPVVMSAVVDPVGIGVAASLSRPDGNMTGMSSVVSDLEAKRVGILKELVPGMKRMANLGDFRNSAVQSAWGADRGPISHDRRGTFRCQTRGRCEPCFQRSSERKD